MTAPSPLGAYVPGRGPLHRLRPGAKLLGLIAFSAAVMATHGAAATGIALVAALALAVIAGLRGRALWRAARGFALIAVPLFVCTATSRVSAESSESFASILFSTQWWQRGWQHGFEVVGDLFALILAASALTASTAATDMLDTLAWALRPLRPVGVDPERVALAFSLVIRSIPSILGIARETRAAARARGLDRDPRALVIPLVLRTVAHAQLTGEALAARGIGED